MTDDEAKRFIAQLESGKCFATRHQEDEWGLEFLGDGRFRKWSRMPGQPPGEEILDDEALTRILRKYFNYERLCRGLR